MGWGSLEVLVSELCCSNIVGQPARKRKKSCYPQDATVTESTSRERNLNKRSIINVDDEEKLRREQRLKNSESRQRYFPVLATSLTQVSDLATSRLFSYWTRVLGGTGKVPRAV